MSKRVSTDMYAGDFAVRLQNVSKIFTQWQRGTGANVLRNFLKPEKKIVHALDDVTFSINKGDFVAYAGPNGAGKSTTMKLLSGMLLPNSGTIEVLGMSPQKQRIPLMSQLGILFGNRTELWWDHPVLQSYEWKKVVWNIPDNIYEKNLALVTELLDLQPLLHTFSRELSLGQRMRADLGMLLLHSPRLILLDEPTLGLDVVAKRQMIEFLKLLNKEQGVTIMVTSHDMDDLEEMAQRMLVISDGKLAFDGSFDSLRETVGNHTIISITTAEKSAPTLQGLTLDESLSGVHTYRADLAQTPITSLMAQLSALDGISGIEIKKAPIEEVIAEVWKKLQSNKSVS